LAPVHAGRVRRLVSAGVQLRHHQRPVHVVVDEIDQHFGADARRECEPQLGPASASATRTQVPLLSSPGALPLASVSWAMPPGLAPWPRCQANWMRT
jgi:hypothetical protein